MNYLDFDLLIERAGGKYKARVLNSPAGQANIEFSRPFSEMELENFLLKIGRPRRSGRAGMAATEMATVKAFGERLFKAVFHDAVYGCLHTSLDQVKQQEAGLRLRLRLIDVPELANVPWEFLYYNSSFDRFFCLTAETPIVRYLDLPERIRPLTVTPPIRILVMISGPYNYPELNVEQEWTNLNEALRELIERGLVTVERLDQPSLSALQKQLRKNDYHILHYIGHGGFDEQSHDGLLILEDEHHQGQPVSGRNLGTLLYDERTLRVVLLNACEGARGSVTDPFAGTAQSLVRQGIPAVIAMQFEVTDQAAVALSNHFYEALADGFPVDAALAEARRAIFALGNNIEWGTPVLYMRSPDGKIFDIEKMPRATPEPQPPEPKPQPRKHVFISYKRNIEPDQSVALQIYEALRGRHDVFIDQSMLVGTPWVERIMNELNESDCLITLLSAQAVQSEMLQHEIATAHRLSKQQNGRPKILPVRLAFSERFQYPLNTYLDPINWASWQTPEDTPRLIEELKKAITGETLPISGPPARIEITEAPAPNFVPPPDIKAQPLDMPEGTMDLQSRFYVKRDSDDVALAAIARQGVTITIKAPRQMGKSSLLIRTMAEARKLGKRVAFLDFQLFDKAALSDADTFFRQFCALLTVELELADKLDEYWKMPLGNSQRCSRYMNRHLLTQLQQPLVLAMDEVESIFDTEFRSDFFGMLRTWHNNRATEPIWKKLDLALVTSTEPYQLIENLNQSPFNVGEVIDLQDFTPEQVTHLNQLHGAPLTPGEEQQLLMLLGGHPYLVRRALYLVASKRITAADLFSQAADDRGPFGDHLRYHLFRLYGKKELIDGFNEVIRKNTCPDDRVFFRLRGAGLVRQEARNKIVPRCSLYAIYFREHLK